MDMATQARVLAITAKCLEILAPLPPGERKQIVTALLVASLDDADPRDREFVDRLMSRVSGAIGGEAGKAS